MSTQFQAKFYTNHSYLAAKIKTELSVVAHLTQGPYKVNLEIIVEMKKIL